MQGVNHRNISLITLWFRYLFIFIPNWSKLNEESTSVKIIILKKNIRGKKSSDILLCLAESADRLITKQEVYVSAHALSVRAFFFCV